MYRHPDSPLQSYHGHVTQGSREDHIAVHTFVTQSCK